MKSTKESPSGGEKLLRLLASGSVGSNDSQSKVNQHINTQGVNNMPLNFAQGNFMVDDLLEWQLVHGWPLESYT